MGTLWLQIVLPSKLIGQRRHRCCSFIGPSRHQSVISQVPLKFKTFFLRGGGGIELQPNSCNRSPQQQSTEENTLNNSHICAWYAAAHKKNGSNKGRGRLFSVNLFFCYQTSEQVETWCEATFFLSRMKTWEILHRFICHLVGRPVVSSDVKKKKVSPCRGNKVDLNGPPAFNETSHQKVSRLPYPLLSVACG